MAELFLVRHGQASLGADNYDCLSDAGVQQSLWLGEHFARDGVRFDPSGKGRAMKDWLESTAEPADWTELALGAIAFTAA